MRINYTIISKFLTCVVNEEATDPIANKEQREEIKQTPIFFLNQILRTQFPLGPFIQIQKERELEKAQAIRVITLLLLFFLKKILILFVLRNELKYVFNKFDKTKTNSGLVFVEPNNRLLSYFVRDNCDGLFCSHKGHRERSFLLQWLECKPKIVCLYRVILTFLSWIFIRYLTQFIAKFSFQHLS